MIKSQLIITIIRSIQDPKQMVKDPPNNTSILVPSSPIALKKRGLQTRGLKLFRIPNRHSNTNNITTPTNNHRHLAQVVFSSMMKRPLTILSIRTNPALCMSL